MMDHVLKKSLFQTLNTHLKDLSFSIHRNLTKMNHLIDRTMDQPIIIESKRFGSIFDSHSKE